MEITLIVLAVVAAIVGFLVFRAYLRMKTIKSEPESSKIRILTDQNFNNQIKAGVVLVDFWAPWCMPCKLMVPVLNELVEDPDLQKAVIAKLNVDEARATASKFGIRSIPTSIIFKNGKEVERFVGVKPSTQLKNKLRKHL